MNESGARAVDANRPACPEAGWEGLLIEVIRTSGLGVFGAGVTTLYLPGSVT